MLHPRVADHRRLRHPDDIAEAQVLGLGRDHAACWAFVHETKRGLGRPLLSLLGRDQPRAVLQSPEAPVSHPNEMRASVMDCRRSYRPVSNSSRIVPSESTANCE